MIDKLYTGIHTVEVTERDVVIETLRSMITPQQEQLAYYWRITMSFTEVIKDLQGQRGR